MRAIFGDGTFEQNTYDGEGRGWEGRGGGEGRGGEGGQEVPVDKRGEGGRGDDREKEERPGQQLDEGTGLYYLRARWMDPIVGRFLGRDRVMSVNYYILVSNNPTNNVDPNGQDVYIQTEDTLTPNTTSDYPLATFTPGRLQRTNTADGSRISLEMQLPIALRG